MNTFQMAALTLAGGAALVVVCVGLAFLVVRFRKNEQGYPNEQQIEDALLPVVIQAIFSAFKAGQISLDKFQTELEGVDKAKIAASLYDMLPATIQVGKFAVPVGYVKEFVSKEQFAEMIQDSYDQLSDRFDELQARIEAELEQLLSGPQ